MKGIERTLMERLDQSCDFVPHKGELGGDAGGHTIGHALGGAPRIGRFAAWCKRWRATRWTKARRQVWADIVAEFGGDGAVMPRRYAPPPTQWLIGLFRSSDPAVRERADTFYIDEDYKPIATMSPKGYALLNDSRRIRRSLASRDAWMNLDSIDG